MLALRIPTRIDPDATIALTDAGGSRTSCGLSMRNPIAPGETPGSSPESWMGSIPDEIDFLIAWTGTLGEDLFARDTPMNWLGPGQAALTAFLAGVSPMLIERGIGLLLRPHCRHVLGDATTARSFLDALDPNYPVGLTLDPASILEPEMCKAGADHCRRTFEILGPIADLVLLTGAEPDGEAVRSVPLGEGSIGADLLVEQFTEHCREGTPVGLLDDEFEGQAALLTAPR